MSRTLLELEPGEAARVVSVKGEERITKRLMEMGVIPGVSVAFVKKAPFGDPLEIRVRGYNLALRKSEAAGVEVASPTPQNEG